METDIAEFLRGKATQCRALAEGEGAPEAVVNGMLALALELDAEAIAIEAGRATARAINGATKDGDG